MRGPRFSGRASSLRLRNSHGALSSPLLKGELILGDRTLAAGPTGYNSGPFGRLRARLEILGRTARGRAPPAPRTGQRFRPRRRRGTWVTRGRVGAGRRVTGHQSARVIVGDEADLGLTDARSLFRQPVTEPLPSRRNSPTATA
ncbi:hypothetical protein SHJG_6896 [Streptomyces hygroscopicus subsp. jinggangensis 5008]|nr:hypothetical protein SHJG_6896 [Streptomyces hygroscopicus subsp. jinggangensis 5008]AGF66318.1 hypothetical protein SHJGH_6656 [Streptomyces hygroscopicus subsp. jinggangensis TL01]